MNHILVVDDSPVDRMLVGRLLSSHERFHVEFAGNGLEALEQIEARLPLLVVTDLQMPHMDGLHLVETVHQRFANLPVILMTAHGSEGTALEALLAGAADFVPKSQVTSEIRTAVESVLDAAHGPRAQEQLGAFLRSDSLTYELDNDLRLIPPLVTHLQQVAHDMRIVDDCQRVRLAKACEAALKNAMVHGNGLVAPTPAAGPSGGREPASSERDARRQPDMRGKHVHVQAAFSAGEARVTVQDEGPGFDTSRLPNVAANPEHLTSGQGRGLVLARLFVDEVRFNAKGNEITLVKRSRFEGKCAPNATRADSQLKA